MQKRIAALAALPGQCIVYYEGQVDKSELVVPQNVKIIEVSEIADGFLKDLAELDTIALIVDEKVTDVKPPQTPYGYWSAL